MPTAPPNDLDAIAAAFEETSRNFQALKASAPAVAQAAERVWTALQGDGAVFFCGNGGSAADAQHLATELVGRYLKDRPALRAIALTVDTSALTAIANDYGFDHVFARQLRGLARTGDVLVALSTSGSSINVVAAIDAARDLGVTTIGLTGADGGRMAEACDLCIRVPSTRTPRIQEMHIAVGHMVCELVERRFVDARPGP